MYVYGNIPAFAVLRLWSGEQRWVMVFCYLPKENHDKDAIGYNRHNGDEVTREGKWWKVPSICDESVVIGQISWVTKSPIRHDAAVALYGNWSD